MIPAIEMGPQDNNVAFGEKDATQETSPRGQDGKDLHGQHGPPLGAQVGGHKRDPDTAKRQQAEGNFLARKATMKLMRAQKPMKPKRV